MATITTTADPQLNILQTRQGSYQQPPPARKSMAWVSSDQEAEQVRTIARSPEARTSGRTLLATISEDTQPPAGAPSTED